MSLSPLRHCSPGSTVYCFLPGQQWSQGLTCLFITRAAVWDIERCSVLTMGHLCGSLPSVEDAQCSHGAGCMLTSPPYYSLSLVPCVLFVTMSTDVPIGASFSSPYTWMGLLCANPVPPYWGLVMVTLSALSEHKEGQILLLNAITSVWNLI